MFEKYIIILLLILIVIKLKPKQIVQNFSQEKYDSKEDIDAYTMINNYNV